jgi:hypothetical protein
LECDKNGTMKSHPPLVTRHPVRLWFVILDLKK